MHDLEGGTTFCPGCGNAVIVRDWHRILNYRLDDAGHCKECGAEVAGRFEKFAKPFGQRRIPVRLAGSAA